MTVDRFSEIYVYRWPRYSRFCYPRFRPFEDSKTGETRKLRGEQWYFTLFWPKMTVLVCADTKFLPRIARETCFQFHQHFTRAFFIQIFCQSQNVTRKSCQNNVCTKNSYKKTLMKLTPVF